MTSSTTPAYGDECQEEEMGLLSAGTSDEDMLLEVTNES